MSIEQQIINERYQTPPQALPPQGLSRWRQIAPFVNVSRETWRVLVLEGRAPQKINLGARCCYWRNKEVLEWLANPTTYRAGGAA